ncbi:uncharacterized protein LOC116307084, partial [Actinia tenebrosa]|uniref:Uncharacterized protein LOC116307084 n=1 Tax=Actinia tenebrosa TaxID=6105 RepID=A0A6P8J7I3_ACTTE
PALFPTRSWLFSAKTRQGFVKVCQSKSDVIVLDLEDSVAQEMKAKQLNEYVSGLKNGIFQGKRFFVRLCGLNNEELARQVEVLTTPAVYGFVLPKIEGPFCLKEYEKLVKSAEDKNDLPSGSIKFVPILETLEAYFSAEQIVNGSARNVGVFAGFADFETQAYCEANSATCETFFSQVVLAARAAQILPIAGAWDKLDDHVGADKFYRKMKACGFAGAVALTPSQAILANVAFSCSPKERQWAEDVMASSETISVVQPSIQESRQMVGPPHRLIASRICQENQYIQDVSLVSDKPALLPWRTRQRGLKDAVQIGRTLRPPLEITVTESWKALWESAFLTVNRLNTSNEFASRLGLKSAPLSFTLINTLALSLTVTSFSESARVHLGCYDAMQKKPVFPGDTLSSVCRIDDAKILTTKGGNQYTVVFSSHNLVNQKNKKVFTVQKRTMFPPLKIENRQQAIDNVILDEANETSWRQFITSQSTALLSPTTAHAQPSLSTGELIIHNDYKCFGVSETRMLCKLFKITNAHHHNIVRYSPSDILVSGPFVIAAMVSNAEYDVGDVVYDEYPMHININKVNPGDQIGTLTFVKSIRRLAENDDLEEITLHHIGVKNVDLEWLEISGVPEDLFGDELKKPAHYEKLCAAQCPILYRKIACQAVRKIVRRC